MVESFGRPDPVAVAAEDGIVVLPPVQLSEVRVPVVLTLDVDALAHVARQLTAAVAAAVQAGFADALTSLDVDAGPLDPPNPAASASGG